MFQRLIYLTAASAAAAGWAALVPLEAAEAQTAVQFDGAVVASCVLSVGTPGVLGVSASSGTEIGSEQPGGVAAVLSVVATAGAPTISFSAPTLSVKPGAYTGTPTVSLKYTSPGGASQAYTSSASQYTSTNALGDTVTLNAKAADSSGFPAGNYRIQTTATCQQ
ncbi:MAG: hypothetical protein ACLGHC_05915 [Alphaproteobacteria bacterium]